MRTKKLVKILYKIGYITLVAIDVLLLLTVPLLMIAADLPRYWKDKNPSVQRGFFLSFHVIFSLCWYILLFNPEGIFHDAIKTGLGLLSLQTWVATGFIAISHIIGALILQKGRVHTFTLSTFWVGALISAFIIGIITFAIIVYNRNSRNSRNSKGPQI